MAEHDPAAARQQPARDLEGDRPPAGAPAREVPSRRAAASSRPRALRRRVKILFISANTRADPQLALNEEYRRIEQRLESSRFRDAFVLVPALAVQLEDLQRALLKHRPDVVHFACHGSDRAELVLLGEDGAPALVPAAALASYFQILRDNVALVVLNACFASEQAYAIRESIGLTIGMREQIADAAAVAFSGALYEGLSFGRTVRDAFELARTAITASGSRQGDVPQLFEGEGVDANAVCLVGERPRWAVLIAALAATLAVGALAWQQCGPSEKGPIDAPLIPDVPDASPDPPNMACFTGARIRAGVFDLSRRPAVCAALNPSEDCMRSRAPSEIPEIALEDFCLDKYEVTNRELASWLETTAETWRLNRKDPAVIQTRVEPAVFLVRTGDECGLTLVDSRVRPTTERANQPATCMTWMAARDYCGAQRKRLPLELEWELAAKGPEGRAFPWGASMPKHGGVAFDHADSTGRHPVDVGISTQDVSPQGVHDLGGNVAEWVADDRGSGETATIRGGSWNSRDPCRLLGSSCERVKAEKFSRDVGFRCAKDKARK